MRTHYSIFLKSFLVMCVMCITGIIGAYADNTYTYNATASDFQTGTFTITSGGG